MLDANGLEAAAKATFAKANEGNLKPETIESLWPSQHPPHWSGLAEAAITAYIQAVGPEPAVAVKPLEWEKPPHSESLSRAETDFGVYRAWTHFEAGGRWFWSLDGYQKASGEVSNEDEAKATCQADHDARISGRIRSALVATPPAGGDDWTVDDTLTAREILDYLGIGSDASLEPYADRRRDAVAKIIQKRIATTPPAERVVEALLNERQKRAEQVHDRILAARDGIRANLSPDSPEWLRDAFNKLHEAHHIMGGDPFDMHMRAALAAKDGRS